MVDVEYIECEQVKEIKYVINVILKCDISIGRHFAIYYRCKDNMSFIVLESFTLIRIEIKIIKYLNK